MHSLNVIFNGDVSIVGTNRVKVKAQEKVQAAIDIVMGWSKEWKKRVRAVSFPRGHVTSNGLQFFL